MIRTLVLGLAVAIALALAAPGAHAQEPYELQPGDRVEISVLEDPSLNRQVLVAPDGRISMPLAGVIDAGGRTPEQLQAVIRERLSEDFIQPPTVTVSLVGLGAPEAELEEPGALSAIYILGQVSAPGRYDIEPPIDVLQALAIAGGPGVFAARDRIQIRRRVGGADTVILFDYEAVEDGAVPIAPVTLEDGDVIVVPERGLFE